MRKCLKILRFWRRSLKVAILTFPQNGWVVGICIISSAWAKIPIIQGQLHNGLRTEFISLDSKFMAKISQVMYNVKGPPIYCFASPSLESGFLPRYPCFKNTFAQWKRDPTLIAFSWKKTSMKGIPMHSKLSLVFFMFIYGSGNYHIHILSVF